MKCSHLRKDLVYRNEKIKENRKMLWHYVVCTKCGFYKICLANKDFSSTMFTVGIIPKLISNKRPIYHLIKILRKMGLMK